MVQQKNHTFYLDMVGFEIMFFIQNMDQKMDPIYDNHIFFLKKDFHYLYNSIRCLPLHSYNSIRSLLLLRWIRVSTDHIIAAEKRLLSLIKYSLHPSFSLIFVSYLFHYSCFYCLLVLLADQFCIDTLTRFELIFIVCLICLMLSSKSIILCLGQI